MRRWEKVAQPVDLTNEDIHRRVLRESREPDGFAVMRVVGGTEVLFLPGVDDGDAVRYEGEGNDVFGELDIDTGLGGDWQRPAGRGAYRKVRCKGGEAWLVVVFGEGGEKCWVCAVDADGANGKEELVHSVRWGLEGAGEGIEAKLLGNGRCTS